jgi:hypothetical protein
MIFGHSTSTIELTSIKNQILPLKFFLIQSFVVYLKDFMSLVLTSYLIQFKV